MRIVFIGAVEFSSRALKEVLSCGADVVGVCTLIESASNSDHVDLTPIAENHGIPVQNTPDVNNGEMIEWINHLKPDVIFCFGWSRLIRERLLGVPRLGIVGFHPAALPANRGRHPIIWALVLGLKETASTFFFMDEGADSGDILSQKRIMIQETDDAGSLYEKVTESAMIQIREFLPQLQLGSFRRTPQNHQIANSWRKRTAQDGKIDWRMSSASINNLIRGLTRPYIGAHFESRQNTFKVWRARIVGEYPHNCEPGKVLSVISSTEFVVKTGDGAICLCECEPEIVLQTGEYL
uniref:methionyl-tRNA formyltransferase n=1 Tax=Orrella sp. TaxID=1921583 RepID=UPI004048AD5A